MEAVYMIALALIITLAFTLSIYFKNIKLRKRNYELEDRVKWEGRRRKGP